MIDFQGIKNGWQRPLPILFPAAANELASSFHRLCYVLNPCLPRPESLSEATS